MRLSKDRRLRKGIRSQRKSLKHCRYEDVPVGKYRNKSKVERKKNRTVGCPSGQGQEDGMTNASWLLNKEIRNKGQLGWYCSLWHEVKQFSQNEILYMPRNLKLDCLELHNFLIVEIEKVDRFPVKISPWMWLHLDSSNGFSQEEREESNFFSSYSCATAMTEEVYLVWHSIFWSQQFIA